MRELRLNTPLTENDLHTLRIGDLVYLDGVVFTGREGVYQMLFEKNIAPPLNLADLTNVTFHCSPAVAEDEAGKYRIPSVTATASFRFKKYLPRLFDEFGVKVVIGKGGMPSEIYRTVFQKYGAVYLTTVGYGLGALYGKAVRQVQDVIWKDELGLAQAMWILEVSKFGPFIVEGDCRGNSLFDEANAEINKQFMALYEGLPDPILKRQGEVSDRGSEIL